jgi:hypothetical protein
MLSSVLTTLGSCYVGKKEARILSDLVGLPNPRYVLLSFGMFLIALAVVYT